MKKKAFFAVIIIILFVVLIINPSITFTGAKNGLLLWADNVIPTLLPFMIVSNLMVNSGACQILAIICRPVSALLRLPPMASYGIATGLFCGYPMCAAAATDMVRSGKISVSTADYLVCTFNCSSPSFIITYIGINMLGLDDPFLIISVIYVPIIISAFIFRPFFHINKEDELVNKEQTGPAQSLMKMIDDSIASSCSVILKVGAYIMLFSIAAVFICNMPVNNKIVLSSLAGFTEITTGIKVTAVSGLNRSVQLILMSTMTAFGGLSGMAQTFGVIEGTGISRKKYICCKTITAAITCITAAFTTYVLLS